MTQENILIQRFQGILFKKTKIKYKITIEKDESAIDEIDNFIKEFKNKYNYKISNTPKYKDSMENTSKIQCLRYILYNIYGCTAKEIATITKSDRTNVYKSIKAVNNYLSVNDELVTNIINDYKI